MRLTYKALRGALLVVSLGLTACVNTLEVAIPNGVNAENCRKQAIGNAVDYLDLSVPIPPEVSVFETIELEDCTYIREIVNEGSVYLYKKGSRTRKDEPTYLNGEGVPKEVYMTKEGRFAVKPDVAIARTMLEIVDEGFSISQADSLNGINMFIALRVSSTTGKVTDVYFNYATSTYYEKIPIEVFYNIEKRMKDELLFEITDFGKSLTYSSCGWAQCPKGREDDGLTMPENGKLTLPSGKLKNPIGGTIVTP